MALYQDNLVVEQQLTMSALVQTVSSTVTGSGTLALTVASNMAQVLTGSTAGQVIKLPDATTLVVGQRYEVYNAATVGVVLQDGNANPLININPLQLVVLRLMNNSTVAGTWAFNAVDQSMAAMDELQVFYPGTGLSVNYLAGITYFNGVEYSVAAGSITLGASMASGFIYVDPNTHAVTAAAALPNNAVSMASFTTSATAVTSLQDAREFAARNLVWGLTADISTQNSQSTASSGSLEKYARADHKHAMNINLMKAGTIPAASFTGNPKVSSVTFATPFASTSYSIEIGAADGRSWIYTLKTASGFTISSQANQALTGEVSWKATYIGEST